MATITLTEHDEIRSWVAARMGAPAVVDISAEGGTQPMLRLVFDQAAYQDQDQGERPPNTGGYEIVEWEEWFRIFDDQRLGLVVPEPQAGNLDSSHELVGLGSQKERSEPSSPSLDEDIKYIAENSDLSPNQARDLIARHGRDRRILLEKAKTMKAEG